MVQPVAQPVAASVKAKTTQATQEENVASPHFSEIATYLKRIAISLEKLVKVVQNSKKEVNEKHSPTNR
jgi:hypothetical protein